LLQILLNIVPPAVTYPNAAPPPSNPEKAEAKIVDITAPLEDSSPLSLMSFSILTN
jgi:hypothetical protein